ncbi:MAG TPA: hypothetical protein HA292_04735 [Candidatus Nitrosotenuis sp.]|nr:hypothetical protein [Candidatus Nitrosotenuis sp.]HIH46373.1 hypothetical protein [Candidatus Nitrosotenuis sp.]HIH68214.1 hypothetical protein [Candidatus Nitrosotenuis sp.]HII03859.1 hypothetical protein [Candidatus Nitrosotenuis sp.]
MFGRKPKTLQEGAYVFASKSDGQYNNVIVGVVSGIDGNKIGVSGLVINMAGLKNKVLQGKAGPRSDEILKNPTPENCILGFVYRTEHDTFNDTLDINENKVIELSEKSFYVLDGWIRESLPELLNNVLSLPEGAERDQAKRVLKQRMDTLYDKNLKQNLYSVCRSLKVLN